MKAFITTLICFLVIAGGVLFFLYRSADRFAEGSVLRTAGESLRPPKAEEPAQVPLDYLILEDEGGIALEEIERSGVVTEQYAYLAGLEPIQISRGVEKCNRKFVRGKLYDFCFQFATRPPQDQYLEFNLLGRWNEIHFGFGFDDAHGSDPEKQWSIELLVNVDGETMFESAKLTPDSKPVFAKVDIDGAQRVTFISRRIGTSNPFAPVLIDPFVISMK